MNAILKGKWLILAAWIAAAAVLMGLAPNMADLVSEKGQLSIPDTYSSAMANKIMKDISDDDESQVALVFHSKSKLTASDLADIEQGINKLESDKSKLGINDITTHFKEKSLKDQLVSKDGKTILASLSMNMGNRDRKETSKALYKELKEVKVGHYYTSSWMIDEDLNTNSQEGLKKTEGITVIFILGVLLLVFRSVITPIIPLVTVGISYLVSQSIVSFLVDSFDFPISSYTQIFMVAIMFGIGTDYCILLFSRFKEEISEHESLAEAIITTYRTAGKTVFFSGLAVLVGFAAIGFSTFKLYQSAAAVAVGVAVLLLALVTVVPFFMAVLGKKIFWPSKGKLEHKESRLWGAAGKFALARPFIALLIVAAICVPFLVFYDGKLSYNSLNEAGDDMASVKAFDIVSSGFGPGQSMPTQVVIKNDVSMNSAEYVALAEKISQEVAKVDGVDTVRSVTRPAGKPIENLFVSKQADSLEKGVGKGNEGIKKISDGLKKAGGELSKSAPQLNKATDGINGLISGTDELKNGMGKVQNGLTAIETGIRSGSMGAGDIKKGMREVQANLVKLSNGMTKLTNGYKQASVGLGGLQSKYKEIGTGLTQISQTLQGLDANFKGIENKYPDLQSDRDYQTIKGTVGSVQKGLRPLSSGLTQLNGGLSKVKGGIDTANASLASAASGQSELDSGMTKLIAGMNQLQTGLTKAANGQEQVIGNISKFQGGLTSLNTGQKQLLNGFSNLNGQMNSLTNGLNDSANGLNQVHKGLNSAQGYLSGLASSDKNVSGLYIPDEVLNSKDFKQALDAYMSPDRKVMTMDVIFKDNPYSNEAISEIDPIKKSIAIAVKDTSLENAKVAIGGVTSTYNDMSKISDADYSRTVVLMLAGIGIILFLLLRSIVMPIYLIASLVLTYYTSMAITEVIFVNILGYEGISWAVPFFAFVILIALGIDYSIFLMDRFNEYKDMPIKEAMLLSMRKMGTVIISAAIILGGTFAAMMPAGVLSLLEIATLILIGLVLYALVILPLFIPIMAKTFGKANWWPFIK
ncbi:putative drug exporter of the RND superfamily [Bacillus sp. OV322]|uniref:MMPL family transporter n=1 Tax=Bacillus sp. OV322 TaxID=1882764 RepID=UPI0008DF309D|nr:MMPL family transporter [Bacillus sp. OV322]SFC96605.1 putative drug exporter of the RND superfamily [Bacillus sp. OV322]